MVAPLDWGLGHATRCVPIVRALLQAGAQVRLAGSGESLTVLTSHFPQLESRSLPGYQIRFKHLGSLFAQMPHLVKTIRHEQATLDAWVQEGWIDAVISDNRYGLHHPQVPTVMVCHQLAPLPPFGGHLAQAMSGKLHLYFLKRFTEVWVPDVSGSPNLAGDLCHRIPYPYKLRWIGPLSRLAHVEASPFSSLSGHYPQVALLSGPEPQRSMLEDALRKYAKDTQEPLCIVRGKPAGHAVRQEGIVTSMDYMDGPALKWLLQQAECVIARPGYSSLMDFMAVGVKSVVLIPTPGQTEQQYLGRRLAQMDQAQCISQNQISKHAFSLAGPRWKMAMPQGAILTHITTFLQTHSLL